MLVNLKALDSRFLMICCSRLPSVSIACGSAGSTTTLKGRRLSRASWLNERST
ncbi:hypothetical protein D3C83_107550 [compost metagenome]